MNSTNVVEEKEKVIESARVARNIVKIAAGISAASVWYIKSRGDIFTTIIESFPAELILQLAMIIYYLSWVFGVTNDLGEQEKVLIAKNKQGPNFQVWGLLFVLLLTFGTMCLSTTYLLKMEMLLIFIGVNIGFHFYYRDKIINPIIKHTIEVYESEKREVNILKAKKVYSYLNGEFQIKRLIYAAIFILIITIAMITPINNLLETYFPRYGIEFIYSLVIFAFILVFEIPIWIKRLDVKFSIKAYEEILNIIEKI